MLSEMVVFGNMTLTTKYGNSNIDIKFSTATL